MLSAVRLAVRPELTIAAVTCGRNGGEDGGQPGGRPDEGWSPPEGHAGYRLVLVRRGRFRRRVRGQVADLDPSVGYLGLPGDEEHFAHPAGGDVCTSVAMGPALWRSLTGEAGVEPVPSLAGGAEPGPVLTRGGSTRAGGAEPSLVRGGPGGHAWYVDARVDLAHRRLLRAARTGDVEHAVVERLVALLADVVRMAGPRGKPHHDLALVSRAREAIRADDPAAGGLLPLAAMLGVSPFRLSRAFSRHLGVPVTRYRNRVRVERALDRLEEGADDLAALAADLGFADQAHLCRTMRQHLGEPPSVVRRLFV